ncbi:MAG: TrkA C-terminal domain-containing protein [Candidatus Omnitrophota bacterium]
MDLLLFFIIILVSFIAVRIGAIAFQLTGLKWSLAQFQALSCFTGTGFTTKEAELITVHPQRRRIASILMVLGNAGLVTLIATFVNSMRPSATVTKITLPFLHLAMPARLLPLVNLLVMLAILYILYWVFSHKRLAVKLTNTLRDQMAKREVIKRVSFEELMVATGGYGVSQIEICKESPIADKSLSESGLRSQDVTVLAIERKGATIPNPPAGTRLLIGDRLVCFGKLENIRKVCGADIK